jgi:hypothetical protein
MARWSWQDEITRRDDAIRQLADALDLAMQEIDLLVEDEDERHELPGYRHAYATLARIEEMGLA